ncbi:MAG: hypothetical protein IKH24_03285 [Bacteroidales bacterium]|nr:hypothetical protein [Bacteroidales bacterium]
MKQIIRIACALLFVTAAVAACDVQLEPTTLQEDSIELRLICADPAVKATEAGDDTYKENTIEHIDYFIYATRSGACLLHNRVINPGTSCTVSLKNLVSGGSLSDGGKCYVYVVANWPDTFTGSETVAQLQVKSVVSNNFDVAVAANHRFVMDCEEAVEADVSRTGSAVDVDLYRLAAKLTMKVNIPASITTGTELTPKTYTPLPNSLQIYYLYATNTGVLNGTPLSYNEATSFNYPYNRAVTVTELSSGSYKYLGEAAPFYTYPRKWESHEMTAPYFKVVLSWSDGVNVQPYYYKVLLPESMGGKIDRNTLYKFVMNIGVLGSETDDGSVEIDGTYYVVDWKDGTKLGDPGTISRGNYLLVASPQYIIYGGNSIEIPVTSSHDISVTVNSATYPVYSSGSEVSTNLPASKYSVTTDRRYSFTLTHDLVTNITSANLDCTPYTFNVTVSNGVSPSKQIQIIQYPPVYITSEASNKYVFLNGHSNHNNTGWEGPGRNFTLIHEDAESITNTEFTPTLTQNGSPYNSVDQNVRVTFSYYDWADGGYRMGQILGIDGTITVASRNEETTTIKKIEIGYVNGRSQQDVSYNPAGSSSSKTEWNGSASSVTVTMETTLLIYQNQRNVVNYIKVYYEVSTGGSGSLGALCYYTYQISGNSNYNIYTVSVSTLTGNNAWYIADPRSQETVTYSGLRGGSNTGTSLSGYRPVSTSSENAIAPKFKIASSAGANYYDGDTDVSRVTFEQANHRCASYQENGYPAGRWRVPTDAEIRFVINLSKNNKIPSLFGGNYWAASGVVLNDQGEVVSGATKASVRCVYDAWYWGNSPESSYLTTWSGWQTNN